MKLSAGSKLVMIGDSITDCGRAQPLGESWPGSLGNGYVQLIESLLMCTYPQRRIRVVNVGSGGHTVRDLKARWQRDVIDLSPNWLSVMIGTNDVWRQFDCPRQPEWHVYEEEYEQTYSDLLQTVRPRLDGLVLMTPFYIEPNPADPMRSTMDRYGQIVRRLAEEFDAHFVDTQAAFDELLQTLPTQVLAGDRVHPFPQGHMTLAKAFLNAVGFDWRGK